MAAENEVILNKYKITHVLCVCEEVSRKENIIYKHVNIVDIPGQDIKKYFPECLKYIEKSIQEGGRVLVHCIAGISRSASVVIAYLIYKNGMTFTEALKFA